MKRLPSLGPGPPPRPSARVIFRTSGDGIFLIGVVFTENMKHVPVPKQRKAFSAWIIRLTSKGNTNQAVVLLPCLTQGVLLLALRELRRQRALLQSPSSGSDKQKHIHPALKSKKKKK